MADEPMLYDAGAMITPVSPPPFLKRVYSPQNYPELNNPDGSVSTHEMAAEIDEDTGTWMTFPMIQQLPNGSLKRFKDVREAMVSAKQSGNVLQWRDGKAAQAYAMGGYKKGTPLDDPLQGILSQFGGKK